MSMKHLLVIALFGFFGAVMVAPIVGIASTIFAFCAIYGVQKLQKTPITENSHSQVRYIKARTANAIRVADLDEEQKMRIPAYLRKNDFLIVNTK